VVYDKNMVDKKLQEEAVWLNMISSFETGTLSMAAAENPASSMLQ
jgi:hypothetical protein